MLNSDWVLHRIIWQLRILRKHKKKLKKYYDKEVHSISETNQKIRELIMTQRTYMVGRLGNTEL